MNMKIFKFGNNNHALKCPDCGVELSIWKKVILISRNRYSIHCGACKKKLKLPKWSNLCYFINALIFVFPIVIFKTSFVITFALIGMYGLLTSIIVVFYVPLISEDE